MRKAALDLRRTPDAPAVSSSGRTVGLTVGSRLQYQEPERTVRLDILTASSINGVLSPGRGLASLGLLESLSLPSSILDVQYALRRRYDAVFVGPNTVLIDNPALTSHAVEGHTPIRVTLDPAGKIPRHFRFLDGSARTIIGVSEVTPPSYLNLLAERGVEALVCGDARVDLGRFLSGLAAKGLHSVMVEGGGRLNRALLDQNLVDHIHLVLVPIVLASEEANTFEGTAGPLGNLRLAGCDRFGDYLLVRYDVVRPAAV